ncbi:Ornithine carbamoyltransferase, mitochondrial [Folsomia candida]|uniref:ornithine carbamoyltransferase n=1 Tax=Folsomia candida TaxID=158441 RepID=A0A226DY32_FOLCA|nr:Ornithine carbamoyltransferase, mitochondrial [Folsomia candida]
MTPSTLTWAMCRNLSKTIVRRKNTLPIIRRGQIKNAPAPLSNQFDVEISIPSDLMGRDLVTFDNYRTQDIYSLLWIAVDLKQAESLVKKCEGKSICVISDNPIRKISLSSAITKLGAATTFINPAEISHETMEMDLEILGKTVGSSCDVVVFDSKNFDHTNLEKFATGCTVPVICTESSLLCPIYCLGELLTLFEHYDYLRRLVISFLGDSSDQLLNTYALLYPKVGMHLHYFVEGNMDFNIWNKGIELAAQYNTEFKQFDNFFDLVYRSHTLSLSRNSLNMHEVTIKVDEIFIIITLY